MVENKILDAINAVSKMLHISHEDIEKIIEMLSSLLSKFQYFRNNWGCIEKDAFNL